jgi:glyoxylate reductase
MSRVKVAIDVPFPGFLAKIFEADCEILPWSILDADEPTRLGVDAIVSFTHYRVGDNELDLLPNTRVISNYGVGVDHIDVAAARRRSIPVGNTPGTVDGATADLTMALMLGVARGLVAGDSYSRGPEYVAFDPTNLLGRDVFGATLGIIGLGRIGCEVAKRARGFDMRILYHNRRPNPEAELSYGVEYRSLDELLSESDFVSLNTPLTESTRDLIGAEQLERMKPSAFLINTARGAVVDHDALYEALSEQRIAGAAIDVTEPEPLPRDHRLLTLSNLIMTPHLGTSTIDTRIRMGEITHENLMRGLRGDVLVHEVTD